MAIAARNSEDDNKKMMITDLDIDSLQISTLRPSEMYSASDQAAEREKFFIRRHSYEDEDAEELTDVARLFELNLAHELAS